MWSTRIQQEQPRNRFTFTICFDIVLNQNGVRMILRTFILCFAIGSVGQACKAISKKPIDATELMEKSDGDNSVMYLEDDKFTGEAVTTFEDGSIKEEFYYENGMLHGSTTAWYQEGKKKKEETFVSGVLDGLSTYWSPDGTTIVELTYKMGQPWDGVWTSWYPNGQKKEEGKYKEGRRYGAFYFWYENGKMRKKDTYKEGKIYTVKEWDEEGKLVVDESY